MAGQVHDGVGRGQREERRDDRGAVDDRIGLLHVMAELARRAGPSRPARAGGSGSTRAPFGVTAVHAMRRRPGRRSDLLQERPRRWRRLRRDRPRPAPAVASRRAALSRTRQRDGVLGRAAGQSLAGVGRHRVATARGLEADQPAAGGRRADRAEAVGGVRHREHARADRRGGAAARAAGDAREIPGIACRAVQLRLAGETQPELAGVGAAEDDEAGALEADHVLAVGGRRRRVGEEASSCGSCARRRSRR